MTIKELKKDAKIQLTGGYIKNVIISLLYFAINFAFTYCAIFIKSEIAKYIYEILALILITPISYGVTVSVIKTTRNEELSYFDFIKIGFSNMKKVWSIYLRILLNLIVPMLLITFSVSVISYTLALSYLGNSTQMSSAFFIISIAIMVISLVWLFIKSLSYSLSFYLLYDNNQATAKDITNRSKELMKGNKLYFLGVNLSFIGWYLLLYVIVTLIHYFVPNDLLFSIISEAGSMLFLPYITATIIEFYEELVENNKTNKKEDTIEA